MSLAAENNKVNNYFRLIRNWDNELKKDLIIKLTNSIHDKSEDSYDFSACFGAWEDDRNANEIIDDLRNDRVNFNNIEEF
jgi:hypothetical protein